jgi:Zinc knuckle/Retrotransposon gag protein
MGEAKEVMEMLKEVVASLRSQQEEMSAERAELKVQNAALAKALQRQSPPLGDWETGSAAEGAERAEKETIKEEADPYLKPLPRNAPEFYVEQFITSFRRVLKAHRYPVKDWVDYLSTALKGAAGVWYEQNDQAWGDYPLTWDIVTEALRAQYNNPMHQYQIRSKMLNLKVGFGGMLAYNSRMQELLMETDDVPFWDFYTFYLNNLTPEVKGKILEANPTPTSREGVYNLATRLDLSSQRPNSGFDQRKPAGGGGFRDKGTNYGNGYNKENGKSKEGGFKPEERKCYACGKTGHIARDCKINKVNKMLQMAEIPEILPEEEEDSNSGKDSGTG